MCVCVCVREGKDKGKDKTYFGLLVNNDQNNDFLIFSIIGKDEKSNPNFQLNIVELIKDFIHIRSFETSKYVEVVSDYQ